jgi:iron complex outermembrane receptor protein
MDIARQEWVSAQAGYEVQSGPVKGLGIRFEGNNINKPIYKEYKSDGTLNATNQTGATYALKFFYKFQQ